MADTATREQNLEADLISARAKMREAQETAKKLSRENAEIEGKLANYTAEMAAAKQAKDDAKAADARCKSAEKQLADAETRLAKAEALVAKGRALVDAFDAFRATKGT